MRANSARGAEQISLLSAGLAQPEPGTCAVSHRNGAVETDDLTAFAGGLIADAAQILVTTLHGVTGSEVSGCRHSRLRLADRCRKWGRRWWRARAVQAARWRSLIIGPEFIFLLIGGTTTVT
jgi:hypothetical protein